MDIRHLLDFAFHAALDVFHVVWGVPLLRFLIVVGAAIWLCAFAYKSRINYRDHRLRHQQARHHKPPP
jgi:hypothetical protein